MIALPPPPPAAIVNLGTLPGDEHAPMPCTTPGPGGVCEGGPGSTLQPAPVVIFDPPCQTVYVNPGGPEIPAPVSVPLTSPPAPVAVAAPTPARHHHRRHHRGHR